MSATGGLGYVSIGGRGGPDAFLAGVAERLACLGMPLAGAVQYNPGRGGRARCEMDLRLLPDGRVLRISQDLGAEATACRLDPGALDAAVVECLARLPSARLLVVNKFGRQEATGRGFVPAIAEAMGLGIPVLIGVAPGNLPDFLGFAEGLAQVLPADPDLVIAWARARAGFVAPHARASGGTDPRISAAPRVPFPDRHSR